MWGDISIAFIIAFIITFVTTPFTIKIAKKIGAVDIPKDKRRMHNRVMPKFGGPAVILGFLISTAYLLITMSIEGTINLFTAEEYGFKLIGVFLGIVIITITGILDDIKTLKPYQKLIGQLCAAVVVVGFGTKIEIFTIPFLNQVGLSEVFSIIVTIIWVIGITNAINLIDGLDGLSSGITLISCVSLLIVFALNGSPTIALILITAMIGALTGFLPSNFAPAKTFIGEAGSNFLGFMLSIISILGVAKTYTAAVIVLPVIVLGLPIFDVLFAIIRRTIKAKSLKAMFKPDKGHLHHKLVAKGFSQRQAVLILYGLSAAFGMFAVILADKDSSIWKAISFLLMVIAAVAIGFKNFTSDKENNENQMYECINCKYIYNPKTGNEKQGVKPGTQYKNLPEDWTCPVCGQGKDKFEMYEYDK